MTSKFKEIIALCESRGFVKSLLHSKNTEELFGPVGFLLQENLKNEWLQSSLTNRDINVFLNMNKSLSDSYDFVKNICQERLPFGIVQILFNVTTNSDSNLANEVDHYFQSMKQIKMQSFMFVSPAISTQYFYKWQQQRRMWWRKVNINIASPGRYSLTDIQTTSTGKQSAEILSTYSWGSHVLEEIFLTSNDDLNLSNEQLQVRDGRKKVQAHLITSTTYLSKMVLNMLCDAYDEPLYQEKKRPLLRFHRKIAPYKISFVISTNNATVTEELNELALYLCKKLRSNFISVLFLPNISRNSLESQWSQYDQMGIPYSVILNDSTLKNGIAHLRSRDTTLKEQIHISDLTSYVEKLFKNY